MTLPLSASSRRAIRPSRPRLVTHEPDERRRRLAAWHRLTARLRTARRAGEVGFLACNELLAFAGLRQVALVRFGRWRKSVLVAHSGLAQVEQDSPYARWLAELALFMRRRYGDKRQREASPASRTGCRWDLQPDMLPAELAAPWQEWWPPHLTAWPFMGPDGRIVALLVAGSEATLPVPEAPDSAGTLLDAAVGQCAYAWWALTERRRPLSARLGAVIRRRHAIAAAGLALAAFAIPVRDYALVPAEIVSTRSQVIASPRDGVVSKMHVPPNARVQAGDVLATLDDTTLANRRAVAEGALASARLALHQASQRAIHSQSAKEELNLAAGRVRERSIEVASLQREMAQLVIRAPADGVFVYSDPDDWAGRPVRTGERVGMLADPSALGVRAWAPVSESVNLESGAPMTVFLRVAPLDPVRARVDYAGYQAVEAPDGTASYMLRGPVEQADGPARIGLRGTARITGDRVALGYLILRRPIASLRAWTGL